MAISGGKYLVGENGDYADLSAAITDIGANVYTDLEFVIISPFTDLGLLAYKDINFGNPNLTFKITSPVDPKGKPICAFQISLSGTRQQYFGFNTTGDKSGKIIVQHLHIKNIDQPTALPSYQIAFQSASPYPQQQVQVHNCIFDGGGYDNTQGLRLNGTHGNKVWNCIFREMPGSGSYGIRCYGPPTSGFDPSRIDNCVFHNIDHAIHYNGNRYYTNNCIGFGGGNPFNDAVGLDDETKANSYGNISDYTSIPWDEPRNRIDADVADQFISLDPTNKDFMVPVPGSYLETFGAEPIVDLNTTDVEGTARPNSALAYSTGVVGRREKLREHWASTRKFTIDGSKIKVSTSSIQLCLTQVADGMTDVLKSAKADGGDLRITTDRWGWEELPIEVAQWDPDNEKCMVWFKPAAVVAGEDYSFYLWFGNPNADHVPLNHDYGQWAVWEDHNLVVHCLEDPVEEGYVKDSSSKMHYGVFDSADADTWQDGIADSGAIGKAYRCDYSTTACHIKMPAGDYVNGLELAQITAWTYARVDGTGYIFTCSKNGSSVERLSFRVITGISQYATLTAPDGGSIQTATDSNTWSVDTAKFLGIAYKLSSDPEKVRWYQDGQFTEQDDVSGVTSGFTNSDSDEGAIGGQFAGTGRFQGELQEIWLHALDRDDAFQETLYENLENGDTFFKAPSAVNQRGARDIVFTTEEGEVHLAATDFYITYDPALYGGVVMTLNAVWEAVGLDQDWGLPRREAIESELRHLAKMIGKYGTLTIGPDYEHEFDKMTLSGVQVEVADNNTAIVYSMTFNPEESYLLSRSIVFDGRRIDAQEFFVAYTRDDRTVFKEVFRAAPLRIESGPNLTRVRITGLIAITGDAESALGVRQRVETFLKEWSTKRQGTEGTLEIDGTEVGTAHLVNVEPSDLSIPGRLALSLDFATDYGS